MSQKKKKVLLIGWDAADWKLFNPLVENNEVPSIQRMIDNGVMGNLATLQPVLSPMLWNSISTGKRPYKHGIFGFTEVNKHTNTVGPSLSTSRTSKAIWNILSQEGYKAHVVNWFASHPAEKINGTCISEFYSKVPKDYSIKWELGKDVVHPADKKEDYRELRLHPSELEGEILQMFAPLIHQLDKDDKRIKVLANLIAEALTIHNATTNILEQEEWDFLAVYYGSIDHFSHAFMHYHPPQMAGISDEDFQIFKDVVPNVYRFHDRMLERLLQLADEDTVVIVCSDHGFQSDHLRPKGTPMVPAGPAIWHRDQGLILMEGPGIAKDELIHGASLLDITPTILQIFGLPLGRDMDGRPLLEAFDQEIELKLIDSWEDREGEHDDGMHPEDITMSSEESDAVMEQFIALGYIDPPSEDSDEAVVQTNRELLWNLARAYIDGNQIIDAIKSLEELVDNHPERREFTSTLANCLGRVGLENESSELMLTILESSDQDNFLAYLARAEIALSRENFNEAMEFLGKLEESDIDFSSSGALAVVSRHVLVGSTYMKLLRWDEALEQFRMAIQIDEDFPRAWLGLAQCYVRKREFDAGIDAALTAISLEHNLVPAHYWLGCALAKSKNWERAVDAFSTTLHYAPDHVLAHTRLVSVFQRMEGDYEDRINFHKGQVELLRKARQDARDNKENEKFFNLLKERNAERVKKLRPYYVELTKTEAEQADERLKKWREKADPKPNPDQKTFTIVSGLPRSGTSLVMQMLQAGGMEVMTDGERVADEDNPEGYLEWEAIKQIKANPELIEQAEGKVTKVISMLIPSLPRSHRYRTIFVVRPIQEIVASQLKMIERRGTKGADLDPEALTKTLKRHRSEIFAAMGNLPMRSLTVYYHKILQNPERAASRMAKFLGEDVLPYPEKMAAVVNKDLYRNRIEQRGVHDTES